jgi:hypothetical protein
MVKCVPASFWVAFLTSALKCLQVLWCLVWKRRLWFHRSKYLL